MYCAITCNDINNKNTKKSKTEEIWKLINITKNKHFRTIYLKKSNGGVCLTDKTHFPADKPHKRLCVGSFVAVIRLTGS
jgi:hypothetical protein